MSYEIQTTCTIFFSEKGIEMREREEDRELGNVIARRKQGTDLFSE